MFKGRAIFLQQQYCVARRAPSGIGHPWQTGYELAATAAAGTGTAAAAFGATALAGLATITGAALASIKPKVRVISSAITAFSCPTRIAPSKVASGIFARFGLIDMMS